MSWMDTWSRPGKHAAVPPPLYLTQGENVAYCRTCGRVISSRKSRQSDPSHHVRYCSDRCRHRKPGALDRKIESAIIGLLDAKPDSGIEQTAAVSKVVKGDRRIIVTCDEIEQIVFGNRHDSSKIFGRKKNRASRALAQDDGEWKSVDMVDGDQSTTVRNDQPSTLHSLQPSRIIRPAQSQSEVNGSIGGEKGWAERHSETSEELVKRQEGQRRAEEREMVRRAARRLVVFGRCPGRACEDTPQNRPAAPKRSRAECSNSNIDPSQIKQRKCEALMNGAVVEPSFAKGNWAIRWREDE